MALLIYHDISQTSKLQTTQSHRLQPQVHPFYRGPTQTIGLEKLGEIGKLPLDEQIIELEKLKEKTFKEQYD